MTREQAIWILDPETTVEALAEIEYYAGFRGKEAKIHAVEDACDVACEAMQKLIEYESLEEQGKLLRLPRANWMEIVFGDQEVFWGIDTDYIENPIREITVDSSDRMTWYDGWETVVLKGADENGLDWEFSPEEIGKTVFMTKEAAELALAEMEEKSWT